MDFDIGEELMRKIRKPSLKLELKPVVLLKPEYFYLKPAYKQEYVHSRLESLKESFRLSCKVDNFMPINHCSMNSFYTYGMVSSPTGSKIEDLVYLFNSTDGSNVAVKLCLSQVPFYSLFNGQIVAILGCNPRGDCIQVDSIIYSPMLNAPLTSKNHKPLSLEISKGPFTKAIIKEMFVHNPDLFIFMGPFIESNTGEFEKLDDLIKFIEDLLMKLPNSKAIIIPSLADQMGIKIFPQQAIPINSTRIVSYPNPCYFYANRHMISICNFDNLMDLAFEEKSVQISSSDDDVSKIDRIERLVHHLIHQQSFVPAINSLSEVSYGSWLNMEIAPELYIISSKMKFLNATIGPSTVLNTVGKTIYTINSNENSNNYSINTRFCHSST